MACVSVPAATAEMERAFSGRRPGFRFHPTDQELVSFFLRRKVFQHGHGGCIPDVDLYKFEPHQLPDMDPIRVDAESDGAEVVNEIMQSILGGFGANTEHMHVESESDAANANKDLMQYTLGGGGTDDNPIHVESVSDEAKTSMDTMQFAFGGMGAYNNPIQIKSEVDGVDTDKGEKKFLTDGRRHMLCRDADSH
ncbi:hypothetical protein ZWY2020_007878 [Hordeum vulgare]|nr:hypothetical protein ZWY2020_007878 [Hordeum vulgare]